MRPRPWQGRWAWRGAIYDQITSPTLARLNGLAVVLEDEVDETGKTAATLWEGKSRLVAAVETPSSSSVRATEEGACMREREQRAAAHAQTTHGMKEISPDVGTKVERQSATRRDDG